MAERFEIEIGDNGRPTGSLPEPLQMFLESQIKEAQAKAAAKAAKAAPSLEAMERLKTLEEENQRYQVAEAERQKDWEKARATLEQQHTKKLQDISTALEAERGRARTLAQRTLREQIRAAALQSGAHPDFLDDFADLVLTRSPIDFDAGQDYAAVLKGEQGPTPLDVTAHVKSMLDARPNFRVPPASGGGARGGAYVATGAAGDSLAAQLSAALDAYGKAPTPENMNRYLALQREAQRAAAGA